MPNDAMIQCENLTKRFGHITAVDHLDEALRLKTDDVGTRASLQPSRRVFAKLQARGATGQR